MKSKINLTEEAKSSFRKMYKAGIYKELYKRQLFNRCATEFAFKQEISND